MTVVCIFKRLSLPPPRGPPKRGLGVDRLRSFRFKWGISSVFSSLSSFIFFLFWFYANDEENLNRKWICRIWGHVSLSLILSLSLPPFCPPSLSLSVSLSLCLSVSLSPYLSLFLRFSSTMSWAAHMTLPQIILPFFHSFRLIYAIFSSIIFSSFKFPKKKLWDTQVVTKYEPIESKCLMILHKWKLTNLFAISLLTFLRLSHEKNQIQVNRGLRLR